ncbi:hypothetical protein X943_000534 [Babesia divergens]|uniref:Uncharacterized protein n=1 Tax=Babesia divergens TaxID=32595 RepID=A0AAD9GKZ1_BABDI|nr:hypothetical protein X943_000534 [Babesia divergens]
MAPRGSKIAVELEKLISDPLNTSPWEYESSVVDSFTKDQNASYRFLKNEWAYQDHSTDPFQPAGVIEGGPENYTGMGLRLKDGRDRQRTEHMPYYKDHGNYWRQRVQMGSVSFSISPDANQDVTMDETDLDLEARQWGSWGKRMYTYMPVLESAYRSRARIENPTDICYPWLTRHDIFERTPVHITHGTHFIPEPDPDEVLAAAGLFGGYMEFPHEFPNERLKKQNQLLTEWDRLEAQYKVDPNEETARRIRTIKNILFHYDEIMDTELNAIKVSAEAAFIHARKAMKALRDDPAHNPDVIDYYIRKVPNPTAVGGGCSRYRGPGKTVALCLVGYFPDPKLLQHYTSIEEMAEGYHTLITELRKEGRIHTNSEMVLDEDVHDYFLRKERRKFPSLMAEYTPLWSHRKFGPEFGDALKKSHRIAESDLTRFGTKLRKRRRMLMEEDRERNFVDDYSFSNDEPDY